MIVTHLGDCLGDERALGADHGFAAHFKISLHAAVSAGAAVILAIAYGPWLLALGLLVVLVAWSRVELRDHTTPQVVSGAALGLLTGGTVYWLIMIAV